MTARNHSTRTKEVATQGIPKPQGTQDTRDARTVKTGRTLIFIASGFGSDLNAEQKVRSVVIVSVQAHGREESDKSGTVTELKEPSHWASLGKRYKTGESVSVRAAPPWRKGNIHWQRQPAHSTSDRPRAIHKTSTFKTCRKPQVYLCFLSSVCLTNTL